MLNWNSKFRISQVFEGDGGTNPLFVADAIYDAVDNGVKIINYSGFNSSSALITNAITYAKNNDVLFVTSAGNGYGGIITFPATLASSYDNVIAVTGTNNDDLLGEFSSTGAEATISAPGESVYSTMPNYQVYFNSHDYNYTQNYSVMSGTSMASPYVAGVASLMLSVNQNLKPHQIKEVLRNTAVDLGVYGRDNLYGSGRIDAYRAVKASQILLNNPSAQFITSTKQSSQELVEDWYYAVIGNTPYLVRRYKMEVEFDLYMLLDDPSNSLFWFNSNGISGASPNNENPWSYIVQQIGNIVTVKTFNYELKNYFSQDPIGWYRDPSELEIMFLAYGDEPQPSATVSPTTNNVGSVKADTYVSGSFIIYNTGGVTLSLTIQSQTNFDLDPSNSITYEPIIYKTLAPGSSTTVNYDGFMGGAVDYGPFTSTITIKDNANGISKTHTVIGTLLLPDFCYGETTALAASPEELLFDKAFIDFYVADTLQVETKNGEKKEKKSIKERLDFAYKLLKKDKTEKIENICKEIIELYPESEMGISFYAMGLLWEAAYSDIEAPDFSEKEFKSYLKELTERKEKYKINGYAQLIISLLDVGNDIEGLEKLFSDYEYDGLKELALFHQFIHYYIYKQDNETARKVSDQLDKMFVDSRYGYQAHLIFGDEGYSLEGLKELLKKKQESLLAKRGERIDDILSEMPKEYKLFNNYPNPFNPSTTIKYSIPKVSNVKIQVYNMMGQLIKTLVNETKAPGFYNVVWNGTNESASKVASGIYFYRFESDNFVANNKMIYLK